MGEVVQLSAIRSEPRLIDIELDNVIVHAERFRPLSDLSALKESIGEVGLTNPIKVNAKHELLNGRHRLEACRQLGWSTIRAFVYDVDQLRQELIGIDDDLVRKELTALERGERMARKKEIYELLHPEAKHGGAPGLPGGGKAKVATVAGFVADTAQKTGLKERTIREEIQIAKGIAPDVKARIHGTPTASKKRTLVQLARAPIEKQRAAVRDDGTVDEAALVGRVAERSPATSDSARVRDDVVPKRLRGRSPTSDEALERVIYALENSTSALEVAAQAPGDPARRAQLTERLGDVLAAMRRVMRTLKREGGEQ